MRVILLLALLLSLAVTPARADIVTGLVGWWKFDEATSGTCTGAAVKDSSGQSNTGTCGGSPTWVAGHTNGAMSFDGSSQYASLTRLPLTSGSAFTISAWAKATALGTGAIFSTRDVTVGVVSTYGVAIQFFSTPGYGLNNNSFGLVVGNVWWQWNEWSSPTNSIQANVWYHVAAVLSNATTSTPSVQLYIDGSPVTTTYWTATSQMAVNYGSNNNAARIGGIYTDTRPSYLTNYFPGSIDDVRVYNRALNASEVAMLYNGGPMTTTLRNGKLRGATIR